jgi:hypothetical protein
MLPRSLLALLLLSSISARAEPVRFLTGPSGREPEEIAREWLGRRPDAEELRELRVRDRHVSRRGVTHLYFRQQLAGLEVWNAGVTASVEADGRLRLARDRFVPGLLRRARATRVSLSPAQALARAAQALGRPLELLDATRLPPKLVWFPVGDAALRLGFELAVRARDDSGWWGVVVDAGDGALLFRNPWFESDSYRTHTPPQTSPAEGPRVLAVDPADLGPSPLGWHDLDGIPGADSTDTTGSNAFAQEDADMDDAGGAVASGGPARVFDFAFEDWRPPEPNLLAALTQAFYLTSLLHDVHAHLGFGEAGGNFQQVNFGPDGLGGDPVLVDVHDSAMTNNANFYTPPDGLRPRMQLFLYQDTRLVVSAPPAIAGTYYGGRAHFGAALTLAGVGGQIVQALDPAGDAGGAGTTTDACSPLTNPGAVAGRIAFVDRGGCWFTEKVANAQAAGAIAVVVANDTAEMPQLVTMTGVDPSIVIPSLFVSQFHGNAIRAQLGAGVTASLQGYARDSAMDVGVVVHEYGHGVTNRLTGGPSNVNCLAAVQGKGMGEGWSDFWAIAFTAKPGDARTLPRPIASYLLGQAPGGPGLRSYPYTPNMAANPLTFADIALSPQQHFVGTIWASALWELWWNLVEPYGFDPDLSTGSGGNNTALALVTDALGRQPCDPMFLDARDAILAADDSLYASRNRCRIWTAFAKRGMGVSADDGVPATPQQVTEAFDLPPDCQRCGDVDDDEQVGLRDQVLAVRALAGAGPPLVAPEKCNVLGPTAVGDGDSDGVLDDCDGADVLAVRDYLAGNAASLPAVCAPAVGIFR